MIYDITPCPKPRMTRRDKWLKPPRPAVARYRAFKDEVRLKMPNDLGLNYSYIRFYIPVPKSWSKRKKAEVIRQQLHTGVPDLDNLLKALMDALYGSDSHIHTVFGVSKCWSEHGGIEIS